MNSKSVQTLRVPSLLLAAALQVLPIVRAALPAAETATNILAIVFRWGAGVAAALGGVHAVSGASTVITSPLSANIVQGQAFTMRLTAAPNQAGFWTATGLPAGLSLSGTSGATLWQITGTPTVTGTYSVALTAKQNQTSSGSRVTTGTLVINISAGLSPPVIATQPASQSATQGLTATFRVAAGGTAPLGYQWRFQGANLSGQTATNLIINPVTTANAGNYTVVVTNSVGSVTSAVAVLTVIVPGIAPSITNQPAALAVIQGQNATFTVGASGTAPFSYFWRKGAGVVSTTAGSTFTITNAQPADAGSYSVIVSNSAGTATSSAATLAVNPATQSPFIITSPASQAAVAGATVAFTSLAGGSAPLSYQWYFNAAPLGGQTSPSYTNSNVQSASAGSYFVVVTNSFGSATSAVATLELITPPSFTAQPQSRTNMVGGGVNFSVTVSSIAPVSYQWWKGGAALAGNGRVSGAQSNILSIASLQTNDAGGYTVVVTNIAGAVTSAVASLTVTSPPVVLSPMTVQISGPGTVNPDYNGQMLQVGASYSMTATPGSGQVFSGWSGGVSAATPALTFVMRSNLTLRASFAPASATFVKGAFNGLFYETNAVSHLTSGSIKITTTAAGKYSGVMQLFGKRHSFSGQFNAAGAATNTIPRGKQSSVTVELAWNTTDSDQMSGRVTDGTWLAPLLADRAVFDAKTNPAPLAGNYTLVIPGMPGAAVTPAGDGYGAVKVDASGRVTLKGALADGTKLTQSAAVSKFREWPLFASLYRGQGSILGWLVFTNTEGGDVGGLLCWSRGQQPSTRYYPLGFAVETGAIGSKYTTPADEDRLLDFSRGRVWLADGNLPRSFTNQISLTENNRVENRSGNPLRLSINPASGLFKGKVTDPATGRAIPFNGVVLQKQNYGAGFFRGTNQSGRIYFGP